MSDRLVDGVLFDIDDTLVDTQQAFAAALADVARHYLPHLGQDRHGEVLATWRADVGGHYRAYTRGEVGYLEQRMARANALHAEYGGTLLDDEGYREWNAVFEAGFAQAWAAHPDAIPVVEQLLAAGVAVGALTNAGVAYQTTKLAKAGLSHVPVLVGVDTFGVGKPHPDTFLEACRRLGTEPGRTAYVGDELDIDALGAVRAGLVGVWVDRPDGRRHAITDTEVSAARAVGVHVITSLAGLREALRLA